MKKIFLALHLLFLSIQVSYAANYHISSSTGNDDDNGAVSAPWKTLSKIQQYSFLPGDSIFLKKGDTWNEGLKMTSSGTVAQPITIGAYGTGNVPIVDVVASHNNINWTDLGNNIWSTTDVNYHPKRILKDNIEILDAAVDFIEELGTNIPDLVEWHYDTDTKILKMYSISSPANHDIKFSNVEHVLKIVDEHYINVENIEFIGGYEAGVLILASTNISLTNLKIGKYTGRRGVFIGAYKVNGVNYQLSNNIVIDNSTIDSEYTFDYSQAGTAQGKSNRGAKDGVVFLGAKNCELKNSTIKNYTHVNVKLFASAKYRGGPQLDERVVENCKIYNNIITSPDIAYGGRILIDGYSFNNEIYNNLIINTSVRSQINGFDNHTHHNIFKNTKSSPLKAWPTGQAISLQANNLSVRGNIIENNLMIDCESSGIYIHGNNSYGDITNNIIRNNIIYNCGTTNGNIGFKVGAISGDYSNNGNTIENNLIYSDFTTETISFYNTIMNVTDLNSENNTNEYLISNNIALRPMFMNVAIDNFHLQSNSPSINAGTQPLATADLDGNNIPYSNTMPDIGIYEYQGTVSGVPSLALIEKGSSWKYLDNGSNQGTAWQSPEFDDSAWASGATQLGYGDGDEATVVSFGPNSSSKYTTTYFRHTFNLADVSQVTALNLELLRDDGAVVYFNGTEVNRFNMPQNEIINYTTLAATVVSGTGERTYYASSIPLELLVTGSNTLAVEVHQYIKSSSDISFNVALSATLSVIFSDSFE